MKKKIGILLAAIMVLNTVSSVAYGFTNPLKSYNLYEDTHPSNNSDDGSSEKVMDEFYSNSMSASNAKSGAVPSEFQSMEPNSMQAQLPKRRNDDLRESSRRVYGNPNVKPGWLTGPSFYQNPSFESIKAKYKKSDFAGCLQECISYVRLHPNDTLGFYYLAMCYSKVSDKENAIKAYEKVIELNANPMIVKYATNGRNCVIKSGQSSATSSYEYQEMTPTEEEAIKCYPNVNEPELIYPYANIANTMNLTPVDPQTLVKRNLVKLQDKLIPQLEEDENSESNDKNKKDIKINLPFGEQDNSLDKFINAPYGNGLSPELNKEYKQIQLNKIQQNINNGKDDPEKDMHNMKNIKDFDNTKSDSGMLKLAYADPSEIENFSKSPEYVQYRKELEEIQMLLGDDNSKKSGDDLIDLIPYLSDKDKKLSPEAVEALMMRSMMPDFSLVDTKNLL